MQGLERLEDEAGRAAPRTSRTHRRFASAGVCCGTAIAAFVIGVPVSAAAATVPGAPTITSATAGVQNATVAFGSAADNGGAPIFDYMVTYTSTNRVLRASRSGKASPLVAGALAVGVTYTCRVAARNSAGLGAFSAASAPVVPLLSVRRARPGPPRDVQAVARIGSIQLSWRLAPESPRFRQVTEFRGKCESSDGGTRGSNRVSDKALIVGPLTPGKTYTCIVQVSNGNGFGPYSAPSNTVVVPTVPDAPVSSVMAGVGRVSVGFNEPARDGGERIFDNVVTCVSSDGGVAGSRHGPRSPIVVVGLSVGKLYVCSVIARNRAGESAPSQPSASVRTLAASADSAATGTHRSAPRSMADRTTQHPVP
jgi:hypothetical protein